MKLVAIMPARNESWVIGLTLRAVLQWCDAAVVLLHACTDATPEIVLQVAMEFPGRILILEESDPAWREMEHRQRLLDEARSIGATHVAHVDADELLAANLLPYIRSECELLPPGTYIQVAMPCMWRSLDHFRDDLSAFGRAVAMLAFCDDPKLTWKPKADGYQHHSREPHGARIFTRGNRSFGGLMHLQFVSWPRLVAKHARYKMHERVTYPDKPVARIEEIYSLAPNEAGLILKKAPADWWAGYEPLVAHLDLGQEPWQVAECQRLWIEHGAATFEGLDLLGIVGQAVNV